MPRFLIIFLVLWQLIQVSGAQSVSKLSAIDTLKKISTQYKALSHIGYHVKFTNVNSELDDSVFATSGWVWQAYQSEDSIFGSYFHVKGESKSGNFDYFYDGMKGYEGYHDRKVATIINPYSYPNNASNPAKARTSLRLFYSLLSQRDIAEFLLINYPFAKNPKLSISDQGSDWLLKVDYPANSAGALISFEIVASKKDLTLKSSKRTALWNGTVGTERYEIDSIETNVSLVQEHIPLTTSWEGYTINEPAKKSTMVVSVGNWEGQMAPSFNYPLFGNGNLSLKDLKGKYVVLDFWETWCGYCILAIPKMKEAHQKYKSKGVEFVGITTQNKAGVERIIANNQISYPQLQGDTKIINEFGFSARPVYMLLDKEGKVLIYDDWDRIEKFLEKL